MKRIVTTRTTRRVLVLGVVLTVAISAPGVPPGVPTAGAAGPGVLLQWNAIAQVELTNARTPLSTFPKIRPTAHGQSRAMAMVQGAVYDAVNAIDRGYQAYLLDVDALDIDPGASYDAAIATAAHHVLVTLVEPDRIGGLDTSYATTLAGIPDGPAEDEGVAAGEAAAAAMIADRAGDGFMAPFTFVVGTTPGDGVWKPTGLDPDPWVGNLKPFLMERPDQFRSSGPNPLTSDEYTKEFNEVKALGAVNSTVRTPDQTQAAVFWQFAPIRFWNRAFSEVIVSRQLDTVDAARLLGMINLAGADGPIACWNDKWYWNFWRPVTAIREAEFDGNPATVGDPAWTPLFDGVTQSVPGFANPGNPPFPDHPSGHGCLSGAVLRTARDFFGTDKVAITVTNSRLGLQRDFDRLSHALKEIIDARVWGGIHFRTADVQGAVIGQKIAHMIDKNWFQPVDG
jgi:hypothetical protein